MERAGKSLWAALRRVAKPERPLDLLAAVWPLMVGKRLGNHTWPVSWKAGRVEVAVRGEEWRKQLEPMRDKVRKRINDWWGTDLVSEVRFIQAKGAPHPASAAARSSSKEALGESAETRLEAALNVLAKPLEGIADRDLRMLIARVAARYLEKQEKK